MIEVGDEYMKLKKSVKITLMLLLIIILILLTLLLSNKINKNQKNGGVQKLKIEEKLKIECKKLNYCYSNNLERYINYQKKNTNLKIEDIIIRVNLNLDNSFYTNTKETPFLNKEYILVNKYLSLGEDYIPENLEEIPTIYARSGMTLVDVAKDAFVKMAQKAKEENHPVLAMSSYRSYDYQTNLYKRYVANDGVEAADTYSARAGFSEHQTGLCVDVYDGKIDYTNFETTESFQWMQENAHKYGFILRFPKGKEHITGYQYESWHYRYVGVKIATYIHEHNITFEEYYAKFIEPKYQN